ncbi:MAG: hypothetical protein Q9209_002442 [Squamulea sp. 1 TL-2023]
MTTPRSSVASPTSLGPSPLDDESYPAMLYRLCKDHLPPRPFTLTSAIVPPPSNICQYPGCPITFTHAQGLFHYRGEPNRWALQELDFGASNPPPDIWIARDRLLNHAESDNDRHIVYGFIHYHYVPRTAPQQQTLAREYSPSVTSSAVDDTDMVDLTEEMGEVGIEASDAVEGDEKVGGDAQSVQDADKSQFVHGQPECLMKTRINAGIDQQLNQAAFQMELNEAQERAAQMTITDKAVEANYTAQTGNQQDTAHEHPQSPNANLRDLVEIAYTKCVAESETAAEDGHADNL